MKSFTLQTADKEIVVEKEADLISLAKREHVFDTTEANDSIEEILEFDKEYPRKIDTFKEAVKYLATYFEGSYLNIKKIEKMVA